MSAELITVAVGPLVAIFIAMIPLYISNQNKKQAQADKDATDKKLADQEKKIADAQAVKDDVVSFESLNEALNRAAKEERVEHKEALLALRSSFTDEAERLKQRTDHELDRAHRQIAILADEVRELNHRLSGTTTQIPTTMPGNNQ